MTSRKVVLTALVVAVGQSACYNSLGPESVLSVDVQVDRTIVVEGERVDVSVTATDIDGGRISASEVTWISRDPTTIRVEDGTLYAVAPGVAEIVADVRGARDSVRMRVRFAHLSQGEIGVRLQSDGGTRHATGGSTFIRRFLPLEGQPTPPLRTDITTRLGDPATSAGSIGSALAEPDTLVWITFAGDPQVGQRKLGRFEIDTVNASFALNGTEGAIVSVTDPDQPLRTELFIPVDVVDLEIDEVTFQNDPDERGALRGAVAFEAAGIVVEHDTATHSVRIVGPASETTLRVYAEFETDIYELLNGGARTSVTLDGETSTGFTFTAGHVFDEGVLFDLPMAQAGGPDDEFILVQTRVEATGTGPLPVKPLDIETFDPPVGERGTWSHATIFDLSSGAVTSQTITRRGYSTGGEVVLSEYRAPTAESYGIMRGTFMITYTLRDSTEGLFDMMETTAEFILPILPLCNMGRVCN